MKRKYDLICFDLDGTLIEEDNGEVLWQRLSKIIHNGSKIHDKRIKQFYAGELSLEDWANFDFNDMKNYGITKNFIIKHAIHSKLIKGVRETLKELKRRKIKLAVISGSIDILLDSVFPDHPFKDVFINKLYFDKKGIVSHWEISKYGDAHKGTALKIIAKKEKIPLSRTVYIGDHKNDISAAKVAGLSISFNSKSKELDNECDVVIEKKDMKEILKYVL